MEPLGILVIVLHIRSSEMRGRSVCILRRHSCAQREASKRVRDFAENNPDLPRHLMHATWQVDPVVLDEHLS